MRRLNKAFVAGGAVAATAYLAWAGITWLRYGKRKSAPADTLLDRFIPVYEVADRHSIAVTAPPDLTLSVAMACDLADSALVRAIFKGRELILGSDTNQTATPRGLVAQVTSLGWVILAEIPGREIVLGAVTKPWHANVVFRSIPPADFASFSEPDYAKIVWNLRTDPVGQSASVVSTETRVITTDPQARAKFRIYWSFLSPGILLIRLAMLRMVRRQVERRARYLLVSTPSFLSSSP